MSHVIYSDSAEYQRMNRERRIHEGPRVPGASAVHVVFAEHNYIVERGKLSASMAEARRLVHQFMEEYDTKRGEQLDAGVPLLPYCEATLQPITARQVRTMKSLGAQLLDPAQLQAHYDMIVHTCYEAIRDSDEPEVRMQAAHILQTLGFIPRSMS